MDYRKLETEAFKNKLKREIELKDIKVENARTHDIHRQGKGLPLNVFQNLLVAFSFHSEHYTDYRSCSVFM